MGGGLGLSNTRGQLETIGYGQTVLATKLGMDPASGYRCALASGHRCALASGYGCAVAHVSFLIYASISSAMSIDSFLALNILQQQRISCNHSAPVLA